MLVEKTRGGQEPTDLTRGQLMMWTGQRLQPGEPLYNMALCFRIDGPIEPHVFRAAFQALVERCDILRAVFVGERERPRQRFMARREFAIEHVDLSSTPNPDDALDAWALERARRALDPYDCAFDSVLLTLSAQRHAWFLNQHHVMTDAWSVSVLFDQMQRYYGLARAGQLHAAAALPDYREYAAQMQAREPSPQSRKADAYWAKVLEQPSASTTFYRRTPRDRSGRTVRIEAALGADRSARLRTLASDTRWRAFTPELATFQIFATVLFTYLQRVSGHSDLAIGTPSHSRGSAKLKQTAGLFIEMLPLRVRLDPHASFVDVHKAVSNAAHDFLLHAVPGASDFEHARAYDVVLNFITASFGDFDGMPVRSHWVHAGFGDRNHLLRLQVHDFDRRDEYGLFFDLNEETFVGPEREWVVQHFLRLLDAFLEDPEQRVADVSLLTQTERERLIRDVNPEMPSDPPESTVLGLIDEQARARPDEIAITCAGRALSYGELAKRSDYVARQLVGLELVPGARIGLLMPRSIDAIVSILGILKAGYAYLPIDSEYPAQRIAFILADAGVGVLICGHGLDRPDGAVATTPLWMGEDFRLLGLQNCDGPLPTVSPRDPAYLIYTSGSTGQPKGVVVGHDNLLNYIGWAACHYVRGDSVSMPLFTSLAFDLTVTSIFVPLATGGRIVVYEPPAQRREIAIHRVIEDNSVDIVKLTPAHLALVQARDLSKSRIRAFIVGGEDLKTELARTVSGYFGDDVEIYNEYGPTEATVGCMIHRFDPSTDVHASVPIGRAIDNLQVYVLDTRLRPTPQGVAGELYIGGRGVARGYLGREALNRERFIGNPFRPGESMYRTGDLARWNADGVMEYLGRSDQQVKIRGVRIELGEIEAALLEHDGIGECAVLLVEQSIDVVAAAAPRFCSRCGLSSQHPDAQIDDSGVCRVCRDFDKTRARGLSYFRTLDDLRAMIGRIRNDSGARHDSMMLLSGGKDSTYALCRLVDLGLRPLVFTLDNGYISEGAKTNIRRVVDRLGLELVEGTTDSMDAIFADSLRRFSNVCNGCFKVIYTLSTQLAHERGIRHVFTGLSRGQIFETRVAGMHRQRVFDPASIDRTVIEARKAYHRMDDAVSRLLDVSLFQDDAIFDEVRFVDFYRYCDASLEEVYEYLDTRVGWTRPLDTGRSTNCRINEVGIHVHKRERGYHNYALPYSWDVRLGHKKRDAALAELDDRIDDENVGRILGRLGYDADARAPAKIADKFLVAYYTAPDEIPSHELGAWLGRRLPGEFLPRRFVRLDHLPLTPNGKLDRDALPSAASRESRRDGGYRAPASSAETVLADIWAQVLGVDRVGVRDDFFALGGDSIHNIQIVSRAARAGIVLTPQQVFDYPTVKELASMARSATRSRAEQGAVQGPARLTSIQARFLEFGGKAPQPYCQLVLLEVRKAYAPNIVERAIAALLEHHDALRARFVRAQGAWTQELLPPGAASCDFAAVDLSRFDAARQDAAVDDAIRTLPERLDPGTGRLVAARLLRVGTDGSARLLVVIHHLSVDGVSWSILLDDLAVACEQLSAGNEPCLPSKTSSVRQWGDALTARANSTELRAELSYWNAPDEPVGSIPVDSIDGPPGDGDSSQTVSRVLSADDTASLLRDVPAAHRANVPDLVLSALVETLSPWAGTDRLRIDIEGHGREDIGGEIELTRTVGWLTTLYPVTLRRIPGGDAILRMQSIKRQLRAVPGKGLGFGLLRYLSNDVRLVQQLRELPQAEILFNYLGQWDNTFAGDGSFELTRPVMARGSGRAARPYLFEINAVVFAGQLRIDWTFNPNRHKRSTIQALVGGTIESIRKLIGACLANPDRGFSSDALAGDDLDQATLDELIADFGESPE